MFGFSRTQSIAFLVMVALIIICPYVLYPVFLMRVLCAALFACSFNLMIGYVGLLSFGQAAFFGMGSYVAAWTIKVWHVDASIAIIFGGLTAFDFQRLKNSGMTVAPAIAASIFLDIFNIFLFFLSLFGGGGRR